MALALGHPVGHPVDIGLQAMPRYDAGGRLKEKWLPNGVNSRYAYFTDNTLAQVVNRKRVVRPPSLTSLRRVLSRRAAATAN